MNRPRGALATVFHDILTAEQTLKDLDKDEWYQLHYPYLLPLALKETFMKLSYDLETHRFLEESVSKTSWVFMQLCDCLMKNILKFFMTQTSINGLLCRGSMFVFSRSQFLTLTSWEETASEWDNPKPRLLDLGAGDGAVTSVISTLFDEVCVTEVSPTMKWKLSNKGFRILDAQNWINSSTKFEVITCLNLLDRCDRPLDVLRDMKRVLQPNGIVVVAMVVPYSPYVEVGGKKHVPTQQLNIGGPTFEVEVYTLAEHVLIPSGYRIIRWTKLPYLCEGDLWQSYYWLEDVVFVLKVADT